MSVGNVTTFNAVGYNSPMPDSRDKAKRKRGWFRFSLRSLLALVLVLSLFFAWATAKIREGRQLTKQLPALFKQIDDRQQAVDPASYPHMTAYWAHLELNIHRQWLARERLRTFDSEHRVALWFYRTFGSQ